MRSKRVYIPGLALFILIATVAAIAQAPSSLPPGHIPVPSGEKAARCFECHVSQGPPPPEEASFCVFCHDFYFAHQSSPGPRHPINFDWPTRNCGYCHRLHSGPNPAHQVSTGMPNASFCIACHLPPGKVTGEEQAGAFCARCHNLGSPAGHPAAEGKDAGFCYQCHQVEG